MATIDARVKSAASIYNLDANGLNSLLQSQKAFNEPFPQNGYSFNEYVNKSALAFSEMIKSNGGDITKAVLQFQGIDTPTAIDIQNNSEIITANGGTVPTPAQENTPGFWDSFLKALGNSQSVVPVPQNQEEFAANNNKVVDTSTWLSYLKDGGWAAFLLVLACVILFFAVSGLIKENK
jgi:hypothetical protein